MTQRAGTIPELEGLRGLLALWVVLGHWATSIPLSFKPLRQNLWDVQAVDVFIILSGFVITLLLRRESVGYARYLARRWFRIAPVYMVVLGIAAYFLPEMTAVIQLAPAGEMQSLRLTMNQATAADFTNNLLLHIGLLHGLVPLSSAPYAAYAFVGQAWSVALEWQFYGIAPLLVYCLQRWRQPAALVALVAVSVGLIALGHWFSPAFLGNKLPLFIVGAGCAWFWLWRPDALPWRLSTQRFVVLGFAILCIGSRQDGLLGLALWCIVFHCVVLAQQTATIEARLCSVLRWPFVQFLGRISYTLYLVHFLVMMSGMSLLLGVDLSPRAYAGVLLSYLVPVSIVAAFVMSKLVEQPFMRFGKQLTQVMK